MNLFINLKYIIIKLISYHIISLSNPYLIIFLILSPRICANSFALLLMICVPIIFPALLLSIEILIKASSPNLVLVYILQTRKADSSSIVLISLGTTNFKFNSFLKISIISRKELIEMLN